MKNKKINIRKKLSKFNDCWSPKVVAEMNDYQFKLAKGEMFVVPKGVEHKPYAEKECHIMLIEPRGVLNTGEVKNELTAINDNWI